MIWSVVDRPLYQCVYRGDQTCGCGDTTAFRRTSPKFVCTNSVGIKGLKVHCRAIQWFFIDFLRSKMAARRLEATAPANEKQACEALFFNQFRASRSIDVGVSASYPCKVIPLSDKDGLWLDRPPSTGSNCWRRWFQLWYLKVEHGARSGADLLCSECKRLDETDFLDGRWKRIPSRVKPRECRLPVD